jgi:hypothetical protein
MPPHLATIEELRKDLAATSQILSERSRVIALGIIGIWWSAHWGEETGHIPQQIGDALKWPAFLSIAVLILDFLQYVAGYAETFHLHRATEKAGHDSASIDSHALLYRARMWFFIGKLIVLGTAAIWFIVVVGMLI